MPTLPIIARPRPPLGDHSSFATRSSLFARIARHSVVTHWPWLFVSVWGGNCERGDRGAGARRGRGRAPESDTGRRSCQKAGFGGGPGRSRKGLRYRCCPCLSRWWVVYVMWLVGKWRRKKKRPRKTLRRRRVRRPVTVQELYMRTIRPKISKRADDGRMFDRERVVAADKAEYKDFQRASGRRMLHDVARGVEEWSEARSSLGQAQRVIEGTRGDLVRRHRSSSRQQ